LTESALPAAWPAFKGGLPSRFEAIRAYVVNRANEDARRESGVCTGHAGAGCAGCAQGMLGGQREDKRAREVLNSS